MANKAKNAKQNSEAEQTASPAEQSQTQEREAPQTESTARPAYKSRAAALRELADNSRDKRDESLREEGIEPVDTRGERKPDDSVDEDEAAQRADDELEVAGDVTEAPPADNQAETQPPAAATEPPKKRKLIVDGQEREFSEDEIIQAGMATLQKNATADKRLEEATRLLNDARRVAGPGVSNKPPLPSNPSPGVEHSPSGPVPDANTLAKAILYGREEEATEAVATLLGRGRQAGDAGIAQSLATQSQGMSPEQIKVLVSDTIAWQSAKELLDRPSEQGGFADVYSDPVLRANFERRADALLEEGKQYKDAFAAAATETRQWRDNFIKANAPKTGLENREALKRNAGVVRGGGGTPPPPPPESRPKSHDEKLERMRAARGQA